MGLITLILTIVVLGFCLYLLFRFVPMPDPVQKIIIAIIVIFVVVLILQQLGLVSGLKIHL